MCVCLLQSLTVVVHSGGGFHDRGIAWAPATGKAMAELVLHGRSDCIDLDPFDPARFTPTADRGTRGRKRRGENVGEQW